jgi:hypothetical protein
MYGLDCREQLILSIPGCRNNYELARRWRIPVLWVSFLRDEFETAYAILFPRRVHPLHLVQEQEWRKVG